MAQRQKPRLRFSKRLEELHEHEAEDAQQLSSLVRVFFGPTILIVGIAAVVSLLNWLKNPPVLAATLIIVGAVALIARRRLKSRRENQQRQAADQ